MKLVKTPRPPAAIFGHPLFTKRTVKIWVGLIASVFLLESYYIRELLCAEVLVALGFVFVALIGGAAYAVGGIVVLCLRTLGSELKAFGALVSARHRVKATITGLSNAKEEVS